MRVQHGEAVGELGAAGEAEEREWALADQAFEGELVEQGDQGEVGAPALYHALVAVPPRLVEHRRDDDAALGGSAGGEAPRHLLGAALNAVDGDQCRRVGAALVRDREPARQAVAAMGAAPDDVEAVQGVVCGGQGLLGQVLHDLSPGVVGPIRPSRY